LAEFGYLAGANVGHVVQFSNSYLKLSLLQNGRRMASIGCFRISTGTRLADTRRSCDSCRNDTNRVSNPSVRLYELC